MPVVATWCPADAALDMLLPLGLAVSAGTCIVIDLDPNGSRVGDRPTLAELVGEGAERRHLEPSRTGVGYLANGGVDAMDAAPIISAIVERWPAAVLKCDPRSTRPAGSIASASLLPEPHTRVLRAPVVYQRCGFSPRTAPNGIVLPPIRRRTAELLLSGRAPRRSDRWIRSLRSVWGTRA